MKFNQKSSSILTKPLSGTFINLMLPFSTTFSIKLANEDENEENAQYLKCGDVIWITNYDQNKELLCNLIITDENIEN